MEVPGHRWDWEDWEDWRTGGLEDWEDWGLGGLGAGRIGGWEAGRIGGWEDWGLCLGHTGWKRPWGLWRVGLTLKEQKGSWRAPHPWSQRAGKLLWEPSRLPGLEWAGQMPSSPLLLLRSGVWEGPSLLPLLISPASLLWPRTHSVWRGLWSGGNWLGSSADSPELKLPISAIAN